MRRHSHGGYYERAAGKVAPGAGNLPAGRLVSVIATHHPLIVRDEPMESKKVRWVYAAASAIACAGVVVAANVAFAQSHPSAGPASIGAGAPASAPLGTRASSAPTGRPAAGGTVDQPPLVLGSVVDTGIKATDGTWVLYAVPIREKVLRNTHFGLMLGRKLPDGTVTADVVTNETSGSDKAEGFHAGQGGMNVNNEDTPTFGYYAGAATKITGTVHGKTVTAQQATWSRDKSVVFYWVPPKTPVTGLKAYGSNGRALRTGNSSIGVG
jgi:hypothetical protein